MRGTCTLIVVGVAAYASYQHQREYAVVGASDPTGAALWPLSVDGLLVFAPVGVRKAERLSRRGRLAVWLSFWLGIGVSLATNIAAAPELTWQPVLVAAWLPVALLLAAELLAHSPRSRGHAENEHAAEPSGVLATADKDGETRPESGGETAQIITPAGFSAHRELPPAPTAQEVMWEHLLREQAHGRVQCRRRTRPSRRH